MKIPADLKKTFESTCHASTSIGVCPHTRHTPLAYPTSPSFHLSIQPLKSAQTLWAVYPKTLGSLPKGVGQLTQRRWAALPKGVGQHCPKTLGSITQRRWAALPKDVGQYYPDIVGKFAAGDVAKGGI